MSTTAKPTPASSEGKPAENPLKALLGFGQSVWLDYIRRSLISTGELKRLIEEDGLRGVTSNPSIFEKAITGSTDYTQDTGRTREKERSGRQRRFSTSSR